MTNRVLLNNVDHHDLKLVDRHGAGSGESVNQTVIFPTEFEAAQRDYPILFVRGEDGAFQAHALLGLQRDENLFLGDNGWNGHHIPALLQRGPFSIGIQREQMGGEQQDEPMIHIDLDDDRVGREQGEPLFLPHGGSAPRLERAAAALRTIYAGADIARSLYPAWDALGLLQPIAIEITLNETERVDLPGFYAIDAGRCAALTDAELGALHRQGFLAPMFLAMSSLANVNRLIALKNAKRPCR